MQRCASVCIGVQRCASVCSGVRRCAAVCSGDCNAMLWGSALLGRAGHVERGINGGDAGLVHLACGNAGHAVRSLSGREGVRGAQSGCTRVSAHTRSRHTHATSRTFASAADATGARWRAFVAYRSLRCHRASKRAEVRRASAAAPLEATSGCRRSKQSSRLRMPAADTCHVCVSIV